MKTECDTPCRPAGTFNFCRALGLSKELDRLGLCKNENETQCFFHSYEKSHELLRSFTGPCTQVNYQITSDTKRDWQINSAKFHVVFDPPRMTVQEEYLIYDLIATISAIGGTLGLCIGFSFTNFASKVLEVLTNVADCLKKEKVEDDRNSVRECS